MRAKWWWVLAHVANWSDWAGDNTVLDMITRNRNTSSVAYPVGQSWPRIHHSVHGSYIQVRAIVMTISNRIFPTVRSVYIWTNYINVYPAYVFSSVWVCVCVCVCVCICEKERCLKACVFVIGIWEDNFRQFEMELEWNLNELNDPTEATHHAGRYDNVFTCSDSRVCIEYRMDGDGFINEEITVNGLSVW
jgi:hypothetical protein